VRPRKEPGRGVGGPNRLRRLRGSAPRHKYDSVEVASSRPQLVGIYESVLYASDVAAPARLYSDVLKLRPLEKPGELSAVFRLDDDGVLLIFDPGRTSHPGRPVRSHRAKGPGHVAFTVVGARGPRGFRAELRQRWRSGSARCDRRAPRPEAWFAGLFVPFGKRASRGGSFDYRVVGDCRDGDGLDLNAPRDAASHEEGSAGGTLTRLAWGNIIGKVGARPFAANCSDGDARRPE